MIHRAFVKREVSRNGLLQHMLAQCEAVILGAKGGGSVRGFRICDTDFPVTFACGPIRKDEVGELLPFAVVLGSARFSLAELEGVGLHTLVSLGIPWSLEEDAELVVAGFPVARGKVVAIREEMGLRITRVLAQCSPAATVASSGFLLDQASATLLEIKDYDFRRPDKFSYGQILRLRDIHGLVLRDLRARLPSLGELIQAESYPDVDRCTLGEAARNALLECLRGGWRNVVELNLRAVPAEEAASARSLSPNEMVVLVTFGSRAGTSPLLAVVYPYLTLEPFVRLLAR